jgi:hypothetical protein
MNSAGITGKSSRIELQEDPIFGPRLYEDNWLVGSTGWVLSKMAHSPTYLKVDGWTIYSADTPAEYDSQRLRVQTYFIAIKNGWTEKNIQAMRRDHNPASSLEEIIDCIHYWNDTGMTCCQGARHATRNQTNE